MFLVRKRLRSRMKALARVRSSPRARTWLLTFRRSPASSASALTPASSTRTNRPPDLAARLPAVRVTLRLDLVAGLGVLLFRLPRSPRSAVFAHELGLHPALPSAGSAFRSASPGSLPNPFRRSGWRGFRIATNLLRQRGEISAAPSLFANSFPRLSSFSVST